MKIFNFSNYLLNHPENDNNNEATFFIKPETAILKSGMPFFYPDFTSDLRCSFGIIVKIDKLGKCIKEKFASNYYKELSVCVNFIAFDNLQKLSDKGLPWDKSVSFDSSSAIGNFINLSNISDYTQLKFSFANNSDFKCKFNLNDLPFSINKAIEVISNYFTLKIGDLLIIEAPCEYMPLQIGHLIYGLSNNDKLLEIKIK